MKRMIVGKLPVAALVNARHRCAWKGCREATQLTVHNTLPKGWRWLSLWSGPVGVPPWAPGMIEDRDAVLCPRHASQLHDEVLEDIGQRLDRPQGSA